MKEFRTTGPCIAEKHYMVDISDRIRRIRKMVDDGQYFTINRARQYGKTTTLTALARSLREDYAVISMDFQSFGADTFENADAFCRDFSVVFCTALEEGSNPDLMETGIKMLTEGLMDRAEDTSKNFRLFQLFSILKKICAASEKPVVLLIDEVDSASNNQVFLDFLAQLRDGYIARDTKGTAAFHSVILAGVTDIKNLKRRIRSEDQHKFNSPWNIAEDFSLDMSLPAEGIAGMLTDYENDHHTGMDTAEIAKEIYAWTSGYPFLVSRICQIVDSALSGTRFPNLALAWTVEGISEAARRILSENNTLFDSLMGKIYDNAPLRAMLQSILFGGARIPYNPDYIPAMDGEMYGFIKNDAGAMTVANRIFEVRIYNYFLSLRDSENSQISRAGSTGREHILQNGHLNMERLMEKYLTIFDDIYEGRAEPFDEEEGRRRFLLFVRPIINGTGNYYVETETRNNERMDLVIDYLGERFVVELKIWRGRAYHEKGEKQLADYLDHYHLKKGYLLTYCFNKNKSPGIVKSSVNGKELVEILV